MKFKKRIVLLIVISLLIIGYYNRSLFIRADIEWVNFIKFNDITYSTVNGADYGRKINPKDLGPAFATVKYNVSKNVHDPDYKIKDGDAAFLPVGTVVYTLKGYKPTFRLAALNPPSNQLALYQVRENPRAKFGRDMLDIKGKVDYVLIQNSKGEKYYLYEKARNNKLVDMVLNAPMVHDGKAPNSKIVYTISFYLIDGTLTWRNFWLKEGEMIPGIMLPDEFGEMIINTQINAQEDKIKELEKQVLAYQNFTQQITEVVGVKETTAIAEKLWKYHLSINDKEITSSNPIKIKTPNFVISLSEERNEQQLLKQELMDKGKLPGIYYEHLKIESPITYTTDGADGTVVTSSTYTFKNVIKGTVIKLTFSKELQKRLGFKDSELTITIK